jgi:hypothetical protein
VTLMVVCVNLASHALCAVVLDDRVLVHAGPVELPGLVIGKFPAPGALTAKLSIAPFPRNRWMDMLDLCVRKPPERRPFHDVNGVIGAEEPIGVSRWSLAGNWIQCWFRSAVELERYRPGPSRS